MKRSLLKKLFFCTAVIPSFGMVLVGRVTAQTFTVLHSFTFAGGSQPYAGLIISSNTLYGTTINGGTWGLGTVFAVNTDGTGFTNLHSFGTGSLGGEPYAGVILSGDT